jgi:hypothetical protein
MNNGIIRVTGVHYVVIGQLRDEPACGYLPGDLLLLRRLRVSKVPEAQLCSNMPSQKHYKFMVDCLAPRSRHQRVGKERYGCCFPVMLAVDGRATKVCSDNEESSVMRPHSVVSAALHDMTALVQRYDGYSSNRQHTSQQINRHLVADTR